MTEESQSAPETSIFKRVLPLVFIFLFSGMILYSFIPSSSGAVQVVDTKGSAKSIKDTKLAGKHESKREVTAGASLKPSAQAAYGKSLLTKHAVWIILFVVSVAVVLFYHHSSVVQDVEEPNVEKEEVDVLEKKEMDMKKEGVDVVKMKEADGSGGTTGGYLYWGIALLVVLLLVLSAFVVSKLQCSSIPTFTSAKGKETKNYEHSEKSKKDFIKNTDDTNEIKRKRNEITIKVDTKPQITIHWDGQTKEIDMDANEVVGNLLLRIMDMKLFGCNFFTGALEASDAQNCITMTSRILYLPDYNGYYKDIYLSKELFDDYYFLVVGEDRLPIFFSLCLAFSISDRIRALKIDSTFQDVSDHLKVVWNVDIKNFQNGQEILQMTDEVYGHEKNILKANF